jgi:tryptophan synthase alpha chain
VSGSTLAPGLEESLRRRRAEGRKLLVPYITGGLGGDWTAVLEAVAAAGADAVEVGIPFSDPVMDGPTVQEASDRALRAGAEPAGVVAGIGRASAGVPVVVMTYYNLVFRAGHRRMARSLAEAGVSGAIVPDLSLEEAAGWEEEALAAGVDTVLLAAPTTPDGRLREICERSRGFVYAVTVMGVTGERAELPPSARRMARRVKEVTDKVVLLGVGVSTPAQAREACLDADGVIVGSALVRRILDGSGPEGAADFVGSLRRGLDG